MKISRLLAILTILMNREKVTAAELAERFEVSVRTIIRDMQTLGEAGIPITSYQGYEGGYGLVEGYKLNKNVLTVDEMNLALSAFRGLESALGHQSIKNLLDKFQNLTDERKDWLRVELFPWGTNEAQRKRMDDIHIAIENSQLIGFHYYDSDGKTSDRTVEPLQLCLKMSAWYLYGFCLLRNDYRLFKLGRMQGVRVLEQTYLPRENPIKTIPDTPYPKKWVAIELLFQKSAYNRLWDYFDDTHMVMNPDGSVLVKVSYPEDEWVYSTLMSFGNQVKILGPEHVREEILRRTRDVLEIYLNA